MVEGEEAAEAEGVASARIFRTLASKLWHAAAGMMVVSLRENEAAEEELRGAEAGMSSPLRNDIQAQREAIDGMLQRWAAYDAGGAHSHDQRMRGEGARCYGPR